MCLDHGTFMLVCGEDETALEHVAAIVAGDGQLKLIDAFGKACTMVGTIGEIDLLNRRIIVSKG
jgi:predicted RNA-binding protein